MTPNGLGRFAVFDIDVTPHSGEKNRHLFDENYFRLQYQGQVDGMSEDGGPYRAMPCLWYSYAKQ